MAVVTTHGLNRVYVISILAKSPLSFQVGLSV